MHPHRGKSLVLRKTQEANLLPQPCWPSPTPLHMTTTPLQSMSQHYSSSHFLPGSIRSIWHVTWFLSVLSSVSFNKWIFLFLFGNSKSMNCLHVTWEKNLSHCNLQLLTSTDLTHKNFVLLVWTKIFKFFLISPYAGGHLLCHLGLFKRHESLCTGNHATGCLWPQICITSPWPQSCLRLLQYLFGLMLYLWLGALLDWPLLDTVLPLHIGRWFSVSLTIS